MNSDNATSGTPVETIARWPDVVLTLYLKGKPYKTAEKRVQMPILPIGSPVYLWKDDECDPIDIANWVYEFDGTVRCILADAHCGHFLIPHLEDSGFTVR